MPCLIEAAGRDPEMAVPPRTHRERTRAGVPTIVERACHRGELRDDFAGLDIEPRRRHRRTDRVPEARAPPPAHARVRRRLPRHRRQRPRHDLTSRIWGRSATGRCGELRCQTLTRTFPRTAIEGADATEGRYAPSIDTDADRPSVVLPAERLPAARSAEVGGYSPAVQRDRLAANHLQGPEKFMHRVGPPPSSGASSQAHAEVALHRVYPSSTARMLPAGSVNQAIGPNSSPVCQPTLPSICNSMSRLHSTAYSIGSVRVIGSMNPLTTMPIACSSERPRLIR